MNPPTTLDIIIVNWNAGSLLRDCLESIAACDRNSFETRRVVVVDNASSDGSLTGAEKTPLPLEMVRNADNIGFARACNQGARGSSAEYLLFLNPDTRLNADSLVVVVNFLENVTNREYAVCGIQLLAVDGTIARSCARFPTPLHIANEICGLGHMMPTVFKTRQMRDWDHGTERDVNHVIGAFYFVRRSVFEALGGFDEHFFIYLEDLDFSLRVHECGGKIRYMTAARALHVGGGTSRRIRGQRLFYSLVSRSRYCHKHFSPIIAYLLDGATLTLEPITRLGLAVKELSLLRGIETVHGFGLLYASIVRGVWKKVLGQ